MGFWQAFFIVFFSNCCPATTAVDLKDKLTEEDNKC